MRRDYKDEKIEVTVSMANLVGGPEFDEVRAMVRALPRMTKKQKIASISQGGSFQGHWPKA